MSDPARLAPGPGDRHAEEGAAVVREQTSVAPELGLILGSGLGDAVGDDLEVDVELSFDQLPGFPAAAVPGHAGRLALGTLYGRPAAVMSGRLHLYEGHPMPVVTLPVRLLAALGVADLVVTNASGGTDPGMRLGLLVLVRDHINFMGQNPLLAWRNADGSPPFVDVSRVWDEGLRALARDAAAEAGVELREGVYAAVSGPSYETLAEVEMLRRMGADAIGMSTVPEAVAAAAFSIRCLGISCITDVAGTEFTHEDVLEVAARAAPEVREILSRVVPRMGTAPPER